MDTRYSLTRNQRYILTALPLLGIVWYLWQSWISLLFQIVCYRFGPKVFFFPIFTSRHSKTYYTHWFSICFYVAFYPAVRFEPVAFCIQMYHRQLSLGLQYHWEDVKLRHMDTNMVVMTKTIVDWYSTLFNNTKEIRRWTDGFDIYLMICCRC